MFKYHRLTNESRGEEAWLCLIDNGLDLMDALHQFDLQAGQIWKYIKDSPQHRDGHCRTYQAGTIKDLMQSHMVIHNKKEMTIYEGIEFIYNFLTKAMRTIYEKEGKVYVTREGGVRPDTRLRDGEEIVEKCTSKNFVFPVLSERDIKITRWPGGNHFYIMVDGKTATLDGVYKWNTVGAAEDAKKKHLKQFRFQGAV